MLTRIIGFSINNKLIIGLLVLALIGYGAYEVGRLPIDAVPDITDNQVQIITTSPALGAPDVERFITFPIEQANSNIPGLKQIRSFSRFGLSVVTIVFEDGIDVYWERQQVSERLQIVRQQIPQSFGSPEIAPITTGLGEIYQYSIRAEKGYENKYDVTELRTIQDWLVRRQLLGVKGVADVASFGGFLKQYEVAVNPSKLLATNVTIHEVFKALEENNQNTGGAYIEKGPTVLFIRSEGLVGNIQDIENIIIKRLEDGSPLHVRDVADVKIGSATRYGAMTRNGEGEVAGAVVMMLKGANSSSVIKSVKEQIEKIKKTLPKGVIIDPFLDRTKMVNNSISTVVRNLIEGALIVIFVLVLFLGNFRAGLLVASVIPLAMLFAIIMMNTFGVSGNLMSLGALDFGLIVDGAVIIVEAVLHTLTHSKHFNPINSLTQKEMDNQVKTSAGKMMNSAVFGQIIILIVYLPIFTLQGIEGKMFKPMAQTVAFALIGAFVLSLTYIPMVSALFLSRKISHKKTFSDKMMERIEYFYQHLLERLLNFPKLVLSVVFVLFAVAVIILSNLGGEFIPTLPEGDFAVDTRVLPGSSLTTSTDAVQRSQKILLSKFPEIEQIVGKTGSSEIPTDPMPIDASDMMIILKPRNEWTSANNYNALSEKMAKELESIPGVTYSFQYPVAMRFNELMTGARQDVVCKIFGENIDTLSKYAEKLGDISKQVEGSQNIYVETVSGIPQIVIKYDRSQISQYGLNISEVNKALNTAFAGQSSGMVYEGERKFDLVVRVGQGQRKDLMDVQNLLIPTPSGTQIPLKNVANIEVVNGVNQIQRENAQRRIIVGFNVREKDVQTTVSDLQKKVDSQLKLPAGYFITYGGAFENLKQAKDRLSIAVPVSLLLIFILLYFAFQSFKYGLLIYTAIPLSAIGGVLALASRGMPFSISAGVGFIALFGVAVLNGIVLIAEFNRQKEQGLKDLKRIVIMGGKIRLRPVLMTAFVASFGFLPMALSSGEGAEVQRPLATVVIGGLMVATFLTLFVLPVLYILFERGVRSKLLKHTVGAVIIIFWLQPAAAQQPINLQEAIELAIKNNRELKSEKLNIEYLQKLKDAAINIPSTNVGFEYGQLNSAFYDNRFLISQSFKFPAVYRSQKKLADAELQNGIVNTHFKELELKKEVSKVYYDLLYMQEKQRILLSTDSLFQIFLAKTSLRYEKGESNILEKTTAELLIGNIKSQLREIQFDYGTLMLKFKWLLNSDSDFQVLSSEFKRQIPDLLEQQKLTDHPFLKRLEQQNVITRAKFDLEKSKQMPDILLGYNDMSMLGTGANDRIYTSRNSRFRSYQIGFGVPIFFRAQKYIVESEKIKVGIAENEFEVGKTHFKLQYDMANLRLNKNLQTLNYFEKVGLLKADTILSTAKKQFEAGEINYLEWTMLVNNAVNIRSEYIDSVKNFNESVLEIESFINH